MLQWIGNFFADGWFQWGVITYLLFSMWGQSGDIRDLKESIRVLSDPHRAVM